ncbi:hypothetical protein Tco_0436819 [Tanacetum coccineum]
MCDRGDEIYGVSRVRNLRFWYCNYDNERKNITGMGLSFPDYLLAKYEKYQNNSLVWGDRYAEWCNVSPTPGTSSQESNNLRPRDYTFREWTLNKVRHTDIRHMLDKIWEYCKDVHRDNTYWWHDHGFEKEEYDEMEIEIEKYDPPEVQVETFEVRKYSFKGGQKFVCVTKEEDDTLPLGRRNKSRFKEMIRKEFLCIILSHEFFSYDPWELHQLDILAFFLFNSLDISAAVSGGSIRITPSFLVEIPSWVSILNYLPSEHCQCTQGAAPVLMHLLCHLYWSDTLAIEMTILPNEYNLGLKRGNMLDKIWEYCKDVHRDNTYWWHDHGFEKEECDEMEIEVEKYDTL